MKRKAAFYLVLGLAWLVWGAGGAYGADPNVSITKATNEVHTPEGWVEADIVRPGQEILISIDFVISNAPWPHDLTPTAFIHRYGLKNNLPVYKYTDGAYFRIEYFTIPINEAGHNETANVRWRLALEGGNIANYYVPFKISRKAYINSTFGYLSGNKAYRPGITAACQAVQQSLQSSPLKTSPVYHAYSQSALQFAEKMTALMPLVVLVHTKGDTTNGGTFYFRDGTYLNKNFVSTFLNYRLDGGLFFAAWSESAYGAAPALVGALYSVGYDHYIGYTTGVYTENNYKFYRKFFQKAVVPGVKVSRALEQAKLWAQNNNLLDVAQAKLIISGWATVELKLGGNVPVPATIEAAPAAPPPAPELAISWREIGPSLLSTEEAKAFRMAEEQPRVRELRKEHGDRLRAGIEAFPGVCRVAYKLGEGYHYGVSVDLESGAIVQQGSMD